MDYSRKTKQELIQELATLRQRVDELENGLAGVKPATDAEADGGSRDDSEPADTLTGSPFRFSRFMDNSPAVAFMKDDQGRYVYVNRRHEELFQRSAQDMLGRTDFEYLPEPVALAVRENDRIVLEAGRPTELIEDVPTPDGKARKWLVLKFPFADTDGKRYVGGVAIEITKRVRAEEALKQARDQLRAKVAERTEALEEASIFFELSQDVFFIGSFDGTIVRINPAAERLFGWSAAEVVGQDGLQFVHPDDRERCRQEVDKLSRGEESVSYEQRTICKDGSIKWLLWSATPVVDKQIFYAVGHDITARKQMEDELQHSEKLHTQILDAVTDMILCKDPQSRIVYANQAFRDFYGMSMEELQGIIDAEFNEPEYTRSYLEDDRYVFRTGQVRNIPEEPVTRHDGAVRLFHTIKSPVFDSQGKVVQSVGVSRDITERKEIEERLARLHEDLERRVEELAAANRELELMTLELEASRDQALEASKLKSEFVANISHELRTPLTGVIGMTELLLHSALSDEQEEFAAAIQESAQSLLTIISDILDFSKMEAGKVDLESIDFSPVSLVEGSAELVAGTARVKKLSLATFIDPALPPLLKGDPVRLRQVLLNLASNAVKFTEQGEVLLEARATAATAEQVSVRFSVADTGIGLTEEEAARLFQPFVQADGSTTRKYGGTGLGLSICKRLVEIMGGEIGVESAPRQGSTFWFNVPLSRASEAEGTERSFLQSAGAALSDLDVLIVGSASAESAFLSRYLAVAGVANSLAATPAEALDLLHAARREGPAYGVVIIDFQEASEEKLAFARSLRSDPETEDTRLLLLAGSEERVEFGPLLQEMGAVVLNRPVKQAQLIDALYRVTGRWLPRSRQAPFAVPRPERHAGDERLPHPGRHVLLAEDNPVLQELALWQLKKLGYTADAVSNGAEVVEAVSRHPYALVLMDCQMPDMDGYEATLAIRKDEATTGRHIAIVAMTAGAMPGDREHCITAGMDDYLAKPVKLDQLKAVLERWIPAEAAEPADAAATPPVLSEQAEGMNSHGAAGRPIDLDSLASAYGAGAMQEILVMFLREAGSLLQSLRSAVEAKSTVQVSSHAHQLKGLAAVMSARTMEKLSRELEEACREKDWDGAADKVQQLETAFGPVNLEIERFFQRCGEPGEPA